MGGREWEKRSEGMLVRNSRCVLEVHAGVCVGRSISKGPRGWRAMEPDHRKLFYAICRSLNSSLILGFGKPSKSLKQALIRLQAS